MTSNTGSQNFNSLSPAILRAGLDSIYLSYNGQVGNAICDLLTSSSPTVRIGGRRFAVTYASRGYDLILDNHVMNLSLFPKLPGRPLLRVQIRSYAIHSMGFPAAHAQVLDTVTEIFDGQLLTQRISRFDLFVDLIYPGGFKLDDLDSFVTRAKNKSTHHKSNHLTGFSFGKGDLVARIYDKAREEKTHHKSSGLPENTWRVEFQARGKILRRFGVISPDDLARNAAMIWEYETHKWLSLCIPDNPNVSRRTVDPLWSLVQSAPMDISCLVLAHPPLKPVSYELNVVPAIAGYIRYHARKHQLSDEQALLTLIPRIKERLLAL